MRPPKTLYLGLAATLVVVVIFALVAPLSAGAAAGMRQAKRYQGPSSFSAFTFGPGVVGFESDGNGTYGQPFSDPIAFRVPKGARSVKVSIRDDGGLDVLAFVRGDVAPYPDARGARYTACDVPQTIGLAQKARVLLVSPDAGHYGHNWDTGFAGDGGSCFLPLSFPTSGTITVVFSKR